MLINIHERQNRPNDTIIMAHLFDLSGQTALVTGAAGGIGQAMALALAEAGADIIMILARIQQRTISSCTDEVLQRNLSQHDTHCAVQKLGRQCCIFGCDLESPDAVLETITRILETHRFEILVNAAGIQRRADATEYSQEMHNEVMQVNMNSPFAICREVGKEWIADGTPEESSMWPVLRRSKAGFEWPRVLSAKAVLPC